MKKVLVISNGCFSLTDSNGRTLAKLFKGYSPEKLAQLYTYGTPDFEVCKNYYKVTDKDALKSLLLGKTCGRVAEEERCENNQPQAAVKKSIKRTPFRKLARELIWKFSRWQMVAF